MATRVYANALVEPHVVPAFSSYWDSTVGAVRRRLETSRLSATSATTFSITKAIAGPYNWAMVMLVLPGLAAQNVSGNLKGQMRMNENVIAMDAGVQCSAKIWRPSTQAYVATLLANNNYGAISATPGAVGYELAVTLTNRKVPSGWSGSGAALTATDVLEDDCIVIEVGVRFFEAGASSRTSQLQLHQNNGTDLPEDETTTTSNDPWFEFSDTLTFKNKAIALTDRVLPLLTCEEPPPAPLEGQLWPRGWGDYNG